MKLPLPSSQQGVLFALMASLLYGASLPLSKVFLSSVGPWLLTGLLQIGAGVVLTILYALRHLFLPGRGVDLLRRADWPWLGASLLFGGVLASVLLLVGMSGTTAATAALLMNLEGVFTALIAWCIFREPFVPRQGAGLALITLGGMLLCIPAGIQGGALWSTAAIVGACLSWAVANNLSRRIANRDALQISTVRGVVAGSFNTTLALAAGAALPAWPLLLTIGAAGSVSEGVAVLFFIAALGRLGAARAGTYFALSPFVGAVTAVLFLAEPVTPALVGAALLMMAGLWLCLTQKADPALCGQ